MTSVRSRNSVMSLGRFVLATWLFALAAGACAGAAKPSDPPSAVPAPARADAAPPPLASSHDSDDAGPNLTCGTAVCRGHFVPFFDAPLLACCPSDAPGRCGVELGAIGKTAGLALGCTELEQPGTPDATCPASAVGPLPAGSLPACRKASGACGLEVSMPSVIDFGCVDVSAIHPLPKG